MTSFNICKARPGNTAETEKIKEYALNQSQLAQTLYETHLVLSELNENNREMFKNVVEMLKDKASDVTSSTPQNNP